MNSMFYSTFLRDQVIVQLDGYVLYESPYKREGRVEILDINETYRLEIYEKDILVFSVCAKDISVDVSKDVYTEKGVLPDGDEYVEALIIKISKVEFKK